MANVSSASFAAFPGGTSTPQPSFSRSLTPGTSKPITGTPEAINSMQATGNPSLSLGSQRTVASRRGSSGFGNVPQNVTTSFQPRAVTSASSACRIGPSPTNHNCAEGTFSRRRPKALSACIGPFHGTSSRMVGERGRNGGHASPQPPPRPALEGPRKSPPKRAAVPADIVPMQDPQRGHLYSGKGCNHRRLRRVDGQHLRAQLCKGPPQPPRRRERRLRPAKFAPSEKDLPPYAPIMAAGQRCL